MQNIQKIVNRIRNFLIAFIVVPFIILIFLVFTSGSDSVAILVVFILPFYVYLIVPNIFTLIMIKKIKNGFPITNKNDLLKTTQRMFVVYLLQTLPVLLMFIGLEVWKYTFKFPFIDMVIIFLAIIYIIYSLPFQISYGDFRDVIISDPYFTDIGQIKYSMAIVPPLGYMDKEKNKVLFVYVFLKILQVILSLVSGVLVFIYVPQTAIYNKLSNVFNYFLVQSYAHYIILLLVGYFSCFYVFQLITKLKKIENNLK